MRCSPQFTLTSDFTCSPGLQCTDPKNGRCAQCAKGSVSINGQCFILPSQAKVDQQLQTG